MCAKYVAMFRQQFQCHLHNYCSYLAAKDEAQQKCDSQLGVAEEYDVQQVGVGRLLQEQPRASKGTLVCKV